LGNLEAINERRLRGPEAVTAPSRGLVAAVLLSFDQNFKTKEIAEVWLARSDFRSQVLGEKTITRPKGSSRAT
jgi:hypothetical protein